jgi:hypothetical protein
MDARWLLVALGLAACTPGEAETPAEDSGIADALEDLDDGAPETNTTTDTGASTAQDTTTQDLTAPDTAVQDLTAPDTVAGDSAPPAEDRPTPTDTPSPDVAPSGPAYLHADLWSIFWNDRTRCGAERTFLHQCERRGEDCALQRRAVEACNPRTVIYGQVGPERQGERLCQRGRYPDVGGCDASRYDFERLRYWWYGAEWQGNWPFATLKVFPAGTTNPMAWAGRGLVAFSNLPMHAQAAMGGIENHGIDRDGDGRSDSHACAMSGVTSGDAAYRRPFGGFAWVEVPTGTPVVVVAAAGTNFADRAFSGCSRGSATQSPWIPGAPGSTLGCIYAVEQRFAPGRHYLFRYGRIEALPASGPPADLVAAFALPEVGQDIRTGAPCARRP